VVVVVLPPDADAAGVGGVGGAGGAAIVVYPVCPVMAIVSPLVSTENVTLVAAVGFDAKLLHSMVSCLPTVGSWVPSMVTVRIFCVPVIAADVTVTAALAPVSVEVVVIVQVVVVFQMA